MLNKYLLKYFVLILFSVTIVQAENILLADFKKDDSGFLFNTGQEFPGAVVKCLLLKLTIMNVCRS
jgi:hypothetical protein